jgi:hypothetical protein
MPIGDSDFAPEYLANVLESLRLSIKKLAAGKPDTGDVVRDVHEQHHVIFILEGGKCF